VSRRTLERRRAARELWPTLANILVAYFNEDWPEDYGTVDGALAKAAVELPLEVRKSIIREWMDWQTKEGMNNDDLRRFVQDGFGVKVHFQEPIDARSFMNRVHDDFIASIRANTDGKWKP
jgi:hypothetical protein